MTIFTAKKTHHTLQLNKQLAKCARITNQYAAKWTRLPQSFHISQSLKDLRSSLLKKCKD